MVMAEWKIYATWRSLKKKVSLALQRERIKMEARV